MCSLCQDFGHLVRCQFWAEWANIQEFGRLMWMHLSTDTKVCYELNWSVKLTRNEGHLTDSTEWPCDLSAHGDGQENMRMCAEYSMWPSHWVCETPTLHTYGHLLCTRVSNDIIHQNAYRRRGNMQEMDCCRVCGPTHTPLFDQLLDADTFVILTWMFLCFFYHSSNLFSLHNVIGIKV